MVLMLRTILVGALLGGVLGAAGRQDQSGGTGQYEFFSGHIADLADDQVTVERVVLGKNKERRVFVIVSETKIEGTLKKSARVTVGFLASAENRDAAYRIIVRSEK